MNLYPEQSSFGNAYCLQQSNLFCRGAGEAAKALLVASPIRRAYPFYMYDWITGRQVARQDVRWDAQVTLVCQDLLVGLVLDASAAGVFFTAEAGIIDGRFTQVTPRENESPVRVGDPVLLQIIRAEGPGEAAADSVFSDAPGVVCWVGHKSAHGRLGFGICFSRSVNGLPPR